MSARIMVATPHVRPVIGGVWHMTRLTRFPNHGEAIKTLCGVADTADYSDQATTEIMTQCWECDYRYRRDHGMELLPDHPAVAARTKQEFPACGRLHSPAVRKQTRAAVNALPASGSAKFTGTRTAS